MKYIKEIIRTLRNTDSMYYEVFCYMIIFTVFLSMCS